MPEGTQIGWAAVYTDPDGHTYFLPLGKASWVTSKSEAQRIASEAAKSGKQSARIIAVYEGE